MKYKYNKHVIQVSINTLLQLIDPFITYIPYGYILYKIELHL